MYPFVNVACRHNTPRTFFQLPSCLQTLIYKPLRGLCQPLSSTANKIFADYAKLALTSRLAQKRSSRLVLGVLRKPIHLALQMKDVLANVHVSWISSGKSLLALRPALTLTITPRATTVRRRKRQKWRKETKMQVHMNQASTYLASTHQVSTYQASTNRTTPMSCLLGTTTMTTPQKQGLQTSCRAKQTKEIQTGTTSSALRKNQGGTIGNASLNPKNCNKSSSSTCSFARLSRKRTSAWIPTWPISLTYVH
mmetsp:Transcript_9011/g.16634  ORF Transcript_9011/g.16634 Transcript_9011/m.16634 type:complete len:252 (-) Transcript_9011:759-1514(-)